MNTHAGWQWPNSGVSVALMARKTSQEQSGVRSNLDDNFFRNPIEAVAAFR